MDDNVLRKFGSRLRHLRLQRNLSQERLAEEAGLDRTYIGGIERGERNPSLRNINRIARALNVTISELTDFSTPAPSGPPRPISPPRRPRRA